MWFSQQDGLAEGPADPGLARHIWNFSDPCWSLGVVRGGGSSLFHKCGQVGHGKNGQILRYVGNYSPRSCSVGTGLSRIRFWLDISNVEQPQTEYVLLGVLSW